MKQWLKLTLAPVVWSGLRSSLRMETLSADLWDDGPVILSCLHRDILPTIMYVRPARPYLLVSHSPDGDILVKTLGDRHYGFVRGATGEGGGPAFREMVRRIEEGHCVGIAVDGPKGPFGTIQDGVLTLARLTGTPILPLVAVASRAKVLSTWDRTIVPWPGSRVEFVVGDKMHLPRDSSRDALEKARTRLRVFFGLEEVGQ